MAADFRGYGGSYTTDYPEAEQHFTMGVCWLTRVDIGDEARLPQVTDDTLFDYPWLYAVEVGHWYLDDTEAARLREYPPARRIFDDRRLPRLAGVAGFAESMQRVFPDRLDHRDSRRGRGQHVLYDLHGPYPDPRHRGADATASPTRKTA